MTNRQENNGAGQGQSHPEQGQPLGMVIEGSVANGVEVRLDPGVSVEQVKVGTFVTLQGANNRFFGVVTDVSLGSTDPPIRYSGAAGHGRLWNHIRTAPIDPARCPGK